MRARGILRLPKTAIVYVNGQPIEQNVQSTAPNEDTSEQTPLTLYQGLPEVSNSEPSLALNVASDRRVPTLI
jgi:hypothetical protein